MLLLSTRDSRLPRLAWHARAGSDRVEVRCGEAVEIGDGFLVEGVWPAAFPEAEFDRDSAFFGSGIRIRDASALFVPSIATTDPLYHARRASGLHVSNSLPLLLAAIEDELDPRCLVYHHINASMVDGLEKYQRRLPTRQGEVTRLLYRPLRFASDETAEADRPAPPPFPDYAAYTGYLESVLRGLVVNARDPCRTVELSLFSTQSSGFDSTAVNAILAPLGLDRVFTNRHGKAPGYFADRDRDRQIEDDGGPICAALGITPTYIDRRGFEADLNHEDIYLSATEENGELNLDPMLRQITRPTVLFSGQYGEVWRPREMDKAGQLEGTLKRHDLGGQGWSEIRLERGFIHVPGPFIGAVRRDEISHISSSDEMRAWRRDTEYDKPIPARIAVERGVPRTAFGQAKKAAAVQFCPPCVPLDPELRAEYFGFLVRHRLLPAGFVRLFPIVRRVNAYLWFASPRRSRIAYYAGRVLAHLPGRATRVPLVWERLTGSVFCFAVNRRVAELRSRTGTAERPPSA